MAYEFIFVKFNLAFFRNNEHKTDFVLRNCFTFANYRNPHWNHRYQSITSYQMVLQTTSSLPGR